MILHTTPPPAPRGHLETFLSIIVTTEGGVCYWVEARDDVKHPKMHRQSLHNREVSAPHVSQAKVEESCSG